MHGVQRSGVCIWHYISIEVISFGKRRLEAANDSRYDGRPQYESKPIRARETDEQREARKSYSSWMCRRGEAETHSTIMRRLW